MFVTSRFVKTARARAPKCLPDWLEAIQRILVGGVNITSQYSCPMNRPKWTEAQLNLVRELYPLQAIDELAERTGRSRQAVKHMAIKLGLSGKYHWRGTALPVGIEIRRRGENSYVMVKTLDDEGAIVWMRKHHLVWQEHTGKLPPKGTRVIFKDGDRDNCAFANLELIPDTEAALRMTQLRSYPPDLQEVIRLLTKLRKAVHDSEKHGLCSGSPPRRDGPSDRPDQRVGLLASPGVAGPCAFSGGNAEAKNRLSQAHAG